MTKTTMFLHKFYFNSQNLSMAMQQQFYDLISRETAKLVHLRNSYDVVMSERGKKKPASNEQAVANELMEQQQFEEDMKKESEEKKLLLQNVINESAASGFPLPKSMIKLLHSHNGNILNLQIFFIKK